VFSQLELGRDPFGRDPFAEMRRLQSAMNQIFEDVGRPVSGRSFPPVNLWLGPESVAVTAALPGLSQSDIDLSVTEETLTIRGERAEPTQEDGIAWHRRERPAGAFSRTIQLPFRVDPDAVQARFENGLLEIEMRRPAADLPRRIEVKAS